MALASTPLTKAGYRAAKPSKQPYTELGTGCLKLLQESGYYQ
jgi:hypothetical protein